MAQTIKLKRSSVQGRVPGTSDLDLGEVAINTYDGKVYIKKDDGTASIVEVGQYATGSDGYIQYNNAGNTAGASFLYVDDSNNRLGIGTSSPGTALEVNGTVTATTFDGALNWSNITSKPDPTLTLNGDVSGSATFTDLGNATLTVTVANDSHTHDGRYYTETEADNRFVNVTGDTLTGFLTLHADPTNAFHAATKEYVDTVAAASLHYHTPVRLESPIALNATYNNGTNGVGATLTNAGTNAALEIDGVAASLNDRVLVYEQSNAAHNGVYTVTTVGDGSTPWVLTRATDADSYAPSDPDSFGQGDAFYVQEGDTGAGELYVMNTEGTITFGTTGINFVQISSAQIYSAGTGLTLSGTEFSVTSNGISATQLNVSGNGTTSQYLRSDGDGSFTWATPPDIYVTSASFATGTGVLTLTRNDTNTVTVDLDGRYLEIAGDTMTGPLSLRDFVSLDSAQATVATTSSTQIASFPAASYGAGKFIITAKDGSNRHICELLVTHNGTTAVATQYGSVFTSSELATYDVDISGGNVRLLAVGASSNSTVYTVSQTLMDV